MNPREPRAFAWLSRVVLVLLLILCSTLLCAAQVFLDLPPQYATAGAAFSVAASDLNADGKLDVVTANYDGTISVLLGQGNGTFSAHQDFATAQKDRVITVGDFNGDGQPDVATASEYNSTISVLLGNGDGTFRNHLDYVMSSDAIGIVACDFNADGNADLAITNKFVTILLSNGDGTFQNPQQIDVGVSPAGIASADLNRDGIVDIVTGDGWNFGSGSVSILLGNGDGTFQAHQEDDGPYSPINVAVADFNGDSIPDLVTQNSGNFGADTVSVFLGNGDGTFQVHREYVSRALRFVSVADLNGDAKIDIVTTDYESDTVSVLFGNGDGSFQTFTNYAAGAFPESLAVGDFNADGRQDLAVAAGGGNVGILLGNSHGTFSVRVDYPTGDLPSAIAVADFNRDGRPDIVAANNLSNSASVLLQDRNGFFEHGADYSVASPGSIAAADFNGDGNQDFVVGDACQVGVFLGNGDGTFQQKVDFPGCMNSYTVADFNQDGKLDLAGSGYRGVTILMGNGDGTFGPPIEYPAGLNPGGIAVADLNHDGITDIAVANYSNSKSRVSILLGKGDGSFQLPRQFPIHRAAFFVVVGDLNQDGKVDLVVGHAATLVSGVGTLLGNGDGTFQPEVLDRRPDVSTLAIPDVNGDGKLDLVTTGGGYANLVSVFSGNGDGTFQALVKYESALGPYAMAVADFNQDGSPDLAVTNGYPENTVSILLNLRGTRVRASSSPNPSKVGESVTFVISVAQSIAEQPTPTGTVTLKDGSTTLATLDLRQGHAHFITSQLSVGKHKITATYSGDSNFNPNTAPSFVQVVNP